MFLLFSLFNWGFEFQINSHKLSEMHSLEIIKIEQFSPTPNTKFLKMIKDSWCYFCAKIVDVLCTFLHQKLIDLNSAPGSFKLTVSRLLIGQLLWFNWLIIAESPSPVSDFLQLFYYNRIWTNKLLCSKKRRMLTFYIHSEIISHFFLMNEFINEQSISRTLKKCINFD